MKKAIIMSGNIFFAIVVLFLLLGSVATAPKNAGSFSVDKFAGYIENEHFQTDKNYGKITDNTSAAAAGKTAISDRFENAEGSIFEWMGCSVQFDNDSDTYYVRTYHVMPFVLGGAYNVIIQSDGTVLAIWGEK